MLVQRKEREDSLTQRARRFFKKSLRVFASKPFASFALKSFFALNAFNAVFALKTTMEEAK